ncbi:iron-sulfur cluster carrier protein ApbC [Haliea sp. AH-315-K21]|uniref:Iron-sulfur cluster carrier protein n=1 Tax=SAR86 cluster bacterium TaxID=2030880 RepID=A0A2A5CA34_9GAMM|nr:iron-sulfur cluster carrier protein ApbC [Haliea sp. AH-315-K21]MBN4075555.1 iron-sulfur cluster carrier protein ApbC [Gammaproteobacteria bacterium AH-315-E17]PCJ40613.1 MAG: iron-sulfur cluster carrier protein ApbC [SAR86 cluster bacterium]
MSQKQENISPNLEGIKNIIVVASGKGGVGKSTTAVNLALSLKDQGATVGLFDADIYGPSIPTMLGLAEGTRPEIVDERTMKPIEAHGIKCHSIGFLVDANQAMVWRGPMVVGAFNQILNDTQWGELDYLVIDMPPGTGDIQLSLAQSVPVTGAVIVTTPQDVALLDAKRGIEMFRKVGIPILGVVENMSLHVCSECGHAEHIFGEGGAERIAKDYGVDVLGSLPLNIAIRERSDEGIPIVVADAYGKVSEIYRSIAARVVSTVKDLNSSLRTPNISIMDD